MVDTRSAFTAQNQTDNNPVQGNVPQEKNYQPLQQQAQPQQQPPQQQPLTQPQANAYFPDEMRPIPEEDIFSWYAATRPFKKRNRQYFTTIGTIVLLISLILFFAGQFLPVAVVLAVGFLTYIMATIPPHDVLYKITSYGIRVDDNIYYWDEMGRFWFSQKYEDKLLNVEIARFPQRITLVINKEEEGVLREILSEVLLEQQPEPTYYERVSAWLQEKIPLDIES